MAPITMQPGTIDRTTHATRIAVASTSRYAASPPQTPPILRSTTDRVSRRPEVLLIVTGPGASGITIHAATYAIRPPTKPPGTIDRITHTRRTSVTSVSRYSAIPAQTPAIRPAVERRTRCRF